MVTGHDDATTAQTALDSGAYGYVVKPIGPSELRVHVANALRRRRVELEHRNFVQNVSHELRTPLTVILAGAALLRRAEGRQEVDEIATSIEDHGRRLLALVDRLVQVTTLDAPFTPDPGVAVDVRTLLSVAAQPARSTGRTVEVEAPPDGPALLAVQERLAQAVANVVDNACRFAGSGPITLRAVPEGAGWVIEVVDHGPGVPEARRERMWDAFTQEDSGPTRAHGGLGVGLYLCRRIVEWHGGSVSSAETPGGGLTVRMRLPGYAAATSH